MRSFKVIHVGKHLRKAHKIEFNEGRYKSTTPLGAAKKAFTQVFKKTRLKKIFITLQETTSCSSKKKFCYELKRTKLEKPVVRFAGTEREFTINYSVQGKPLKIGKNNPAQQKGGNMNNWYRVPTLIALMKNYINESNARIELYFLRGGTRGRKKIHEIYEKPIVGDFIEYMWNENGTLISYKGFVEKLEKDSFIIDFTKDPLYIERYQGGQMWKGSSWDGKLDNAKLDKSTFTNSRRLKKEHTFRFVKKKNRLKRTHEKFSTLNNRAKIPKVKRDVTVTLNLTERQKLTKEAVYNLMQFADARHDFDSRGTRIWDENYIKLMKKRFKIDDTTFGKIFTSAYNDETTGLKNIFFSENKNSSYETNVFNRLFQKSEWFLDPMKECVNDKFHFFRSGKKNAFGKAQRPKFNQQLEKLKAQGITYVLRDGSVRAGLEDVEDRVMSITNLNKLWDPAKASNTEYFNQKQNKIENIDETYMSHCETHLLDDARNVLNRKPTFLLSKNMNKSDATNKEIAAYVLRFCPLSNGNSRGFTETNYNSKKNLFELIKNLDKLAENNGQSANVSWEKIMKKITKNNKKIIEFIKNNTKNLTYESLIMILYDMKKTGDWGQSFWVRKNKSSVMFLSQDRLAMLFSIYCGNTTIGGFKGIVGENVQATENKTIFIYEGHNKLRSKGFRGRGRGGSPVMGISMEKMREYHEESIDWLSNIVSHLNTQIQQGGNTILVDRLRHVENTVPFENHPSVFEVWKSSVKEKIENKEKKLNNILKTVSAGKRITKEQYITFENMFLLFNCLPFISRLISSFADHRGFSSDHTKNAIRRIRRNIVFHFQKLSEENIKMYKGQIDHVIDQHYDHWEKKLNVLCDQISSHLI